MGRTSFHRELADAVGWDRDHWPHPIVVRLMSEQIQETTAQLKADIDSGRTGDKVAAADLGLSPLGTDDEAAGTPASPGRIHTARMQEARIGVIARAKPPKSERAWFIPTLLGVLMLAVGAIAFIGLGHAISR